MLLTRYEIKAKDHYGPNMVTYQILEEKHRTDDAI